MTGRVRLGMLVLAAAAAAGGLLAGCGGFAGLGDTGGTGGEGGAGASRVDAIFDVARGIGPGEVVKIAGAQVGTITGVRLTATYQARVEMTIDSRFTPFRADASCQIEPEGIISENFVECAPGTPSAPPLRTDGSGTPTVPVAHTAAPISLQDLFEIWRAPVSDRLSVLLAELGIGVSGRAGSIGAILDRANPALAAARRAIALVNGQRAQLQQLVTSAAPTVRRLASHDGAVQRFLTASARITRVTAAHAGALAQSIARLPPLLRSAGPALTELDATGTAATPLLHELRGAGPALTGLTAALPRFSAQATATLQQLSPALSAGRSALAAAGPTVGRLQRFAIDADPAGRSLDRLLVSLRDSGAFESLLRGLYNGAALTSHYDADSHVIFADMLENQCMLYATTPNAACAAHLNGGAVVSGEPHAARSGPHPGRRRLRRRTVAAGGSGAAHGQTPRTQPTATGQAPPLPAVGPTVTTTAGTLQHLLSYLLR
jgi:ABC-type transporter Mla subunit MlaD